MYCILLSSHRCNNFLGFFVIYLVVTVPNNVKLTYNLILTIVISSEVSFLTTAVASRVLLYTTFICYLLASVLSHDIKVH